VNAEKIIVLNFYFAAVFMVNMGDFQVINEVYKEFFSKNFPARSAFQVRTFNPFSFLLLTLSVPALKAFQVKKFQPFFISTFNPVSSVLLCLSDENFLTLFKLYI
jgi:hypothetical protein